jgi:thiamine-monophosphate kinase
MQNLGKDSPVPGFETDASTFRPGDGELLFSTDEFSSEDNFRRHNPSDLGWNLAAATISDIHAAGGIPLFYGHSVTVQSDWDEYFIHRFSEGIAHCLSLSGAAFLGGDLGMSDHWKYTGIAIGKKLASLNRIGARASDLIYMTGDIGSGNLEAALRLYSNNPVLKPLLSLVHVRFPLRNRESVLVRKYANCCIDSSDGLFRALQDLASFSKTGFRIKHPNFHPQGLAACKLLGKPEEILFLGECGEYELVFTIPPAKENDFLAEATSLGLKFSKLGEITAEQDFLLENKNRITDLSGYTICARNYRDVKEYISEIVHFIEHGSA